MKKIVIALDYNPSAEKVAETGYKIASALHAEIRIIHVITEPAYYAIEYSPIMGYQGNYTNGTIAVVKDIKKEAENFLAAAVNHLGDASIKTIVLEGNVTESILLFAEKWKADLLVMGSHNHKGIERLLVTDKAVNILKHSRIPLLTIPTAII